MNRRSSTDDDLVVCVRALSRESTLWSIVLSLFTYELDSTPQISWSGREKESQNPKRLHQASTKGLEECHWRFEMYRLLCITSEIIHFMISFLTFRHWGRVIWYKRRTDACRLRIGLYWCEKGIAVLNFCIIFLQITRAPILKVVEVCRESASVILFGSYMPVRNSAFTW